METTFLADKRELRALVAFTSKDSFRPALSNVFFFSDGRLAATDGHSLVIREPRSPNKKKEFLFGLHREVVTMLVRMMDAKCQVKIGPRVDKRWAEFALSREPYSDEPMLFKGQLWINQTDDTPPAFDEVLPERDGKPAAPRVGFNSELLKRVDLIRLAAGVSHRGLAMYPPKEELAPVLFEAPSLMREATWLAVIMPMRI